MLDTKKTEGCGYGNKTIPPCPTPQYSQTSQNTNGTTDLNKTTSTVSNTTIPNTTGYNSTTSNATAPNITYYITTTMNTIKMIVTTTEDP